MFLGEFMCLVTFKIVYWTLRRRRVSLDKKISIANIMFVVRILSGYYYIQQDGSEDTNGLVKGNRDFNPFILYVPAICDMVGESLRITSPISTLIMHLMQY